MCHTETCRLSGYFLGFGLRIQDRVSFSSLTPKTGCQICTITPSQSAYSQYCLVWSAKSKKIKILCHLTFVIHIQWKLYVNDKFCTLLNFNFSLLNINYMLSNKYCTLFNVNYMLLNNYCKLLKVDYMFNSA